MATTRIMPLHNGKLITGFACDSRTADAEFALAKKQYITKTGRVRGVDDVIAYHLSASFSRRSSLPANTSMVIKTPPHRSV